MYGVYLGPPPAIGSLRGSGGRPKSENPFPFHVTEGLLHVDEDTPGNG